MKKSDLIAQVAEKAELSKAAATRAVHALFDGTTGAISQAVQAGEQVTIPGFGRFRAKTRKARKGRNPQTGAEIDIPERNSVQFSAGKDLKTAVGGEAAGSGGRKSGGARAKGTAGTGASAGGARGGTSGAAGAKGGKAAGGKAGAAKGGGGGKAAAGKGTAPKGGSGTGGAGKKTASSGGRGATADTGSAKGTGKGGQKNASPSSSTGSRAASTKKK